MQHCPPEYYLFSDFDLAEKIIKLSKHHSSAYVIKQMLTPAEVSAVLSRSEIVIGMRLHAIILAVSSGTPAAGAIYHHKVGELVKDLGISNYFINVYDITPKSLTNLVRTAWSERKKIKDTLLAKLPQIKDRIRMGQELLITELKR
jgi:polysaccharide pyruvyl transferase WcaK-like protein